MGVLGAVVDRRLHAGLHPSCDVYRACGTDVSARLEDSDRLFAQLHGEVTIDARFEKAHLLGYRDCLLGFQVC
jgi:hypothetical protein